MKKCVCSLLVYFLSSGTVSCIHPSHPTPFHPTPLHPTPPNPLISIMPTDLAQACEEDRDARAHELPGARLQDQRAPWHALDHRTLHQLRHRHDAEYGRARRSLGLPRGGTTVPAQLLRPLNPTTCGSTQKSSHIFILKWTFYVLFMSKHLVEICLPLDFLPGLSA